MRNERRCVRINARLGLRSEGLQARSTIVHLFARLLVERHVGFNDGLSFNESGKAFMDGWSRTHGWVMLWCSIAFTFGNT